MRDKQLEKLAAEVLAKPSLLDKPGARLRQAYFYNERVVDRQQWVLHVVVVDDETGCVDTANMPLTPVQVVKVKLLWVPDPAYDPHMGIDPDVQAVMQLVHIREEPHGPYTEQTGRAGQAGR